MWGLVWSFLATRCAALNVPILINCGATTGAAPWEADRDYSSPSWPVSVSSDLKLFETTREADTSLTYTFLVSTASTYLINLYFIEPLYNTPSSRIFNIFVNDVAKVSFDIFATSGGVNVPLTQTFELTLTSAEIASSPSLVISLQKHENSQTAGPIIAAIEITDILDTSLPSSAPAASPSVAASVPSVPDAPEGNLPPQDANLNNLFELRLDCGVPDDNPSEPYSYTDSNQNTWISDDSYQNGAQSFVLADAQIANTADPQIYRSERWFWEPIMYAINAPNGEYKIILHFAEIYHNSAGMRVFDVLIENNLCKEDLDIVAEWGASLTAGSLECAGVVLQDGVLDIKLDPKVENPKISGVEVIQMSMPQPSIAPTTSVPTSAPTAIYINCGGNSFLSDSSGIAWIEDDISYVSSMWEGGTNAVITSETIKIIDGSSDAPDQMLFQTCRKGDWFFNTMYYNIPLQNGVYNIDLYFAEFVENAVGVRVMDVLVEGEVVQTGLDIYQIVGGQHKAFVVAISNKPVRDGEIEIAFVPTQGQALVCGIAVSQAANHFGHAVILTDTEGYLSLEDLDESGFVTARLDGTLSHTHMPGAVLIEWQWFWSKIETPDVIAGTASGEVVTDAIIAVGDYLLSLYVKDSEGFEDTLTIDLQVKSSGGLQGCLAYYYDYSSEPALTSIPDFSSKAADIVTVENDIAWTRMGDGRAFGSSGFFNNFAAQFVCYVEVPPGEGGFYMWQIASNDGVKLYIDNELAIDNDGIQSDGKLSWRSVWTDLSEGRHFIKIEYFDGAAGESDRKGLRLMWTTPTASSRENVPAERLKHGLYQKFAVVRSIFPTSGTSAGGTQVTLDGEDFIWAPAWTAEAGMQIIVVDEDGIQTVIDPETVNWQDTDTTTLSFAMPPNGKGLGDNTVVINLVTPGGSSNGVQFNYVGQTFNAPDWGDLKYLQFIQEVTVVEFGPDERIYAGSRTGQVFSYELEYNVETGEYSVLNEIKSSALKQSVGFGWTPDILGIAFNPNDVPDDDEGPFVYLGHCQLFHKSTFDKKGYVTKVYGKNLENWEHIVSNLPCSDHDHGVNGMTFDKNGILLVSVGGNTNAGVPGYITTVNQDEGYYSAAVLAVNMYDNNFDGNIQYQANGVPTNLNNGIYFYSTGLRNTYDIAYHPKFDAIYATDNGPNEYLGLISLTCTTADENSQEVYAPDEFMKLAYDAYFGHPNRLRGSTIEGNERECTYYADDWSHDGYTAPLATFTASMTGVAVYHANTFGGNWRNSVVLGRFMTGMHRVVLSSDGESVLVSEQMPDQFHDGLDLVIDPRGTVFMAGYVLGHITYVSPIDDVSQYTTTFVTSVWPNMGPTTGGRLITIRGYKFGTWQDTKVTFGSYNGPECYLQNIGTKDEFDTIQCWTPDYSSFAESGAVDVYVNSNQMTFVLSHGYTYVTKKFTNPFV